MYSTTDAMNHNYALQTQECCHPRTDLSKHDNGVTYCSWFCPSVIMVEHQHSSSLPVNSVPQHHTSPTVRRGAHTVVSLPKTELAYDASSKAIDHFDRSSETFILKPDDAFYSPVGYHHYIENLSDFNQYISQS